MKRTFYSGSNTEPPMEEPPGKALYVPFFRICNPEKSMQQATKIENRRSKTSYSG
jgi:hypothetical protein